jgi:lipase maturation factor 1
MLRYSSFQRGLQVQPAPVESLSRWLFAPDPSQTSRLIPRWLFLRALGLIFFSAFYSLLFQVRGLVGPDGLLPAGDYLRNAAEYAGIWRWWYAPTVFWLGSGPRALLLVCWVGMAASLLLVLNIWPRGTIFICVAGFVSFISVLQAFSSYQSDGMLLEAGFLSLFFAPPGLRPGLGASHPASRASLFLLQFEWFRIYFQSGLVKILSGDTEWRHLTAMNEYYQNGPLPSWVGWYAQHLPIWFHVGTAGLTLLLELVLIWMFFLPRRFRIVLFWIVTPWQMGIILTSNYAFLNYLVLVLGVLLVDDKYVTRLLPRFWKPKEAATLESRPAPPALAGPAIASLGETRTLLRRVADGARLWVAAIFLAWIFYATTAQLVWMLFPNLPLPVQPVIALEPFRFANGYGLFAVMTRGRYEIEFQGSNDGITWTPYPFRYKPQDPRQASRIFAPYQPRFDWNLWFASLDSWRQNPFVLNTEQRLLTNPPSVLALFASNPFAQAPPQQIRAVIWQYWFTDWAEKRQGLWWRRELLGLYAPQIARGAGGRFDVVAMPEPGESIRQ